MCPHALYGSYFLVMFDALQNHMWVFYSLMMGKNTRCFGKLQNVDFSSPLMKTVTLDE